MTLRELAESASDAVLRRIGRAYGHVQESTPLEADLLESDDELIVVFDAPGVQSSDVQVKFVNDRVLVRIDRFREFHEGYEMRFPGRGLALDGDMTLPEDVSVDPDAASATLTKRGTLEVHLPTLDTTQADDDRQTSAAEGDETDLDAGGEDRDGE
jgi:HSP20 family molecular chaperone IbpA